MEILKPLGVTLAAAEVLATVTCGKVSLPDRASYCVLSFKALNLDSGQYGVWLIIEGYDVKSGRDKSLVAGFEAPNLNNPNHLINFSANFTGTIGSVGSDNKADEPILMAPSHSYQASFEQAVEKNNGQPAKLGGKLLTTLSAAPSC